MTEYSSREFLGVDIHIWAYYITTFCTIFANVFSLYSIFTHILYKHREGVKGSLVRIFLMVNLYSIESWISLRFTSLDPYLAVVRDFWEAVVIYEFYRLIISCSGGVQVIMRDVGGPTPQLPPFHRCFWAWNPRELILYTRWGILQYCLCQMIMGTTIFICHFFGLYHEGDMSIKGLYFWVAFIITMSQSWSLYCLILFYHALSHMKEDSEGGRKFKKFKALSKFIAVKAVVFFVWWQGVGIGLLAALGIIESDDIWSTERIATTLQDCLVCVECLGFGITHLFVFKTSDFDVDTTGTAIQHQSLIHYFFTIQQNEHVQDALDFRDIAEDIQNFIFLEGQAYETVNNEFLGSPRPQSIMESIAVDDQKANDYRLEDADRENEFSSVLPQYQSNDMHTQSSFLMG